MTVTITGSIYDVSTNELSGYLYVSANKSFIDSDGNVHVNKKYQCQVINGEFEIELPETINYTYTQSTYTDDNNIIKFTAIPDGIDGNDITIKIEDGSISDSKITITYDSVIEEYDDVNMDESTSSSYIVDVINEGSDFVTIERLSELTDDTLPSNVSTTNMSGGLSTNKVIPISGSINIKYTFKFVDLYNNDYVLATNVEIPYSSSTISFSDLI
jgi:hypothetical protein